MDRCSMYSVILYPDSTDYDYDTLLFNLIAFVNQKVGKYAFIKHDMDKTSDGILKKAHVHFICKLPVSISFHAFADNVGIKNRSIIEDIHSFEAQIRYLIHADDKSKYQYKLSDIVCNFDKDVYFKDFVKEAKPSESDMVRAICMFINTGKHKSMDDVLYFVLDNGYYGAYRRSYTIICDFYMRHSMRMGDL